MPWNNQSGGNRGNGGGPWGNQPGGGGGNRNNGRGPGQQPPDLDELLRRGREHFNSGFPNGGLSSALIIAVVVVGWLLTGVYTVAQKEQGIILTFGKHTRTVEPGFGVHLPWPIETMRKPPVLEQQTMSVGGVKTESEMLTGDENIIDLQFNVQWRISSAPDFLFKISDPEQILKTTAESVMREVVGQNTLTFVTQDGRDQVQTRVRARMQEVLNAYESGILIDQVKLVRVDPHKSVVEAYRDVQAARADRERMRNEAEAYANQVVPEAQGKAARMVAEAEAYKQQSIQGAEGEAQRFLSVYNEYKKAPDVTRRRIFLETMEEVLAGRNKIILDENAGGVVPYLPLNELNSKKTNQ